MTRSSEASWTPTLPPYPQHPPMIPAPCSQCIPDLPITSQSCASLTQDQTPLPSMTSKWTPYNRELFRQRMVCFCASPCLCTGGSKVNRAITRLPPSLLLSWLPTLWLEACTIHGHLKMSLVRSCLVFLPLKLKNQNKTTQWHHCHWQICISTSKISVSMETSPYTLIFLSKFVETIEAHHILATPLERHQ